MKDYKKGDIIKGQVTGIENYGIFINVDAYYDGLIHISEISSDYVREIKDYVNIGETIYVKILDVDEKNLQIKLSIKDIDYKIKRKPNRVVESKNGFKPLAKALPKWVSDKLKEIDNEKRK